MIVSDKRVKSGGRYHLVCRCDKCGADFTRRVRPNLLYKYCPKCSIKTGGIKNKTHGHSREKSSRYRMWTGMKERCLNKNTSNYESYGGRGITICDEWYRFENFLEWSEINNYMKGLTIDRVDNDKGYSPDNCRFADKSTQAANRRQMTNTGKKYIGVYNQCSSFLAMISWQRKKINLGVYKTELEAAKVRDQYVIDNNLPHTLNFK